MAAEAIQGARRDISRREVNIGGEAFTETVYEVDFGPRNGTARVTVLDPCVTEEAQRKRREAIVRKCEELIRRGMM